MTDNFQKALALLREDVERELDCIHDDAVLAGLTERQQERIMQHAYRRMDALQARWVEKLSRMFAH